ncbi:transporter substrate-binding domain-containing protein [Undibacterium sp. SXout20W]|uniref:transporter substrate-binding domain-containing protein n=1 Tax=Undibacterium sp. SXout20W TaxID=3413051 RepID=UPI003BF25C75
MKFYLKTVANGRARGFVRFILARILFASSLLVASAVSASEPQKVVLLISELRTDSGEIIPVRENVRNLLSYFEHQLHIQFEIHRYPLSRLLSNTKNGEGIAFGLSKNKERASQFVFSDPVYSNSVWMIKRSDNSFTFETLTDLKGKTIGVTRGTTYGDDFDKQINVLFKVEDDVSSPSSRLRKLLNKRMDLMLVSTHNTQASDVENIMYKILRSEAKSEEDAIKSGITVLKKPLMTDDIYFIAAPGPTEDWIHKLNQVIVAGKKSGEINRLISEYNQ